MKTEKKYEIVKEEGGRKEIIKTTSSLLVADKTVEEHIMKLSPGNLDEVLYYIHPKLMNSK